MTVEGSQVRTAIDFPCLAARDLEGRAVSLPDEFTGEHNLVVVAFRREQQSIVDTWIAWFQKHAAERPTLRCYEIPVIATRWSAARSLIDGGMARAVREPDARRRTLTVYTDVRRVTDALAIEDSGVVTVLLVDAEGRVRWRTSGPANDASSRALLCALDAPNRGAEVRALPSIEQFRFEFDRRFRPLLAAAGVTPGTAHVTLTPERLLIRFGPWSCETALTNVREVCRTGPYQWYKAIGPRGSFVDRGVTFGSTTRGGVCILLREPVSGLMPFGPLRHPGITVTVADPEQFVASLRRRIGLG